MGVSVAVGVTVSVASIVSVGVVVSVGTLVPVAVATSVNVLVGAGVSVVVAALVGTVVSVGVSVNGRVSVGVAEPAGGVSVGVSRVGVGVAVSVEVVGDATSLGVDVAPGRVGVRVARRVRETAAVGVAVDLAALVVSNASDESAKKRRAAANARQGECFVSVALGFGNALYAHRTEAK